MPDIEVKIHFRAIDHTKTATAAIQQRLRDFEKTSGAYNRSSIEHETQSQTGSGSGWQQLAGNGTFASCVARSFASMVRTPTKLCCGESQ